MDRSSNDPSYYTASAGIASGSQVTRGDDVTRAALPRSRAQLNREQTIASNVLFIIAVLLYLFVVLWCRTLPTTAFYYVFSINVALIITIYCMWMNASKWFHVPAMLRRKNVGGKP